MEISIPTFTIQWWQIVIVVMYFGIGFLLGIITAFLTSMQAGIGAAFGYHSAPMSIMWFILVVLFWPVFLIWIVIEMLVEGFSS